MELNMKNCSSLNKLSALPSIPRAERSKNSEVSGLAAYLKQERDRNKTVTTNPKSISKPENEGVHKLEIGPVKVDENLDIGATVKFNQADIIPRNVEELPKKLNEIFVKFNGFCELICNKILIDDLLDKEEKDLLNKEISIKELNKESILESHLLNIYSVFERMLSFLFGIFPDNIFSIKDQWDLVKNNKVNENILFSGLDKIESGTTLKLEVFKKTSTSFYGHSLLIKKTNEDEFTFFDPNEGEYRCLSRQDLAHAINYQLSIWGGTDIFISRGDSYKKRLIDKKIIEKSKEIMRSQ